VRRPPVCISPYLDQQQNRWTYSATKRVFFVGAIGHYPNRLAIEWLTQKLAPVLLGIDSEIRIAIVGAADTDIGQQHHHPNIDLLGYANAEVVASLFKTSDIMICPVENDYGVKFKSLEALAYGTPLLASRQTMMGLPHLAGTPSFDLEDVEGTAALLERLVGDGDALKGLAEIQQRRQDDFIRSQDRVWSRALGALLGAGRQTRQG
jgi:glycosyltransferase involved in cell wall biosynthesis